MRRRLWVGAALAAWVSVLGGPALGQEAVGRGAVVVSIEPCLGLDVAAVQRLSALELSSQGVSAPGQTRVAVTCSIDSVQVSVDVPLVVTLTRSIDLSNEPPEVRERLLALAISEALVEVRARVAPPQAQAEPAQPELEEEPEEYLAGQRRGSPAGWLELALDVGMSERSFEVPIDPSCDPEHRHYASLSTSVFPEMGGHLAVFPGAAFTDRWPSGIGLELSYRHHLALHVQNGRTGQEVEASEYSIEVGLAYRAVLGTARRGASLTPRLGFSRHEFFLGNVGNDLVPPFTYDSLALGLDLYIPLATVYVGVELGASYLAVLSVGQYAIQAYNASGALPTTHGFDMTFGLSGQIVSGLRWGLGFELLGFYSQHWGKGMGWGSGAPSTVCDTDCSLYAGCLTTANPPDEVVGGILTTGTARDLSWRLVWTLSWRFGWDPSR